MLYNSSEFNIIINVFIIFVGFAFMTDKCSGVGCSFYTVVSNSKRCTQTVSIEFQWQREEKTALSTEKKTC